MARAINTVQIDGPVEQVFDLVTTTKYWPEWHPATVGVGGVTERPIALGDIVHEQARIGGRMYEGDWTVAEHVRPARVLLRAGSGRIQISYAFRAVGDATEFERTLEYQPEDFAVAGADPAAIQALMHSQSEQGLQRLKRLVEGLLDK